MFCGESAPLFSETHVAGAGDTKKSAQTEHERWRNTLKLKERMFDNAVFFAGAPRRFPGPGISEGSLQS